MHQDPFKNNNVLDVHVNSGSFLQRSGYSQIAKWGCGEKKKKIKATSCSTECGLHKEKRRQGETRFKGKKTRARVGECVELFIQISRRQ